MFNNVIEVKCVSASDVLAPLTDEMRDDFYQYLGEENICWGTNSYSLIPSSWMMEMLESWSEKWQYEKDKFLTEIIERCCDVAKLAPYVDLES